MYGAERVLAGWSVDADTAVQRTTNRRRSSVCDTPATAAAYPSAVISSVSRLVGPVNGTCAWNFRLLASIVTQLPRALTCWEASPTVVME